MQRENVYFMNQKERMLANLPYKAWMDGLSEDRLANWKRIYRFNNLPPEEWDQLPVLLKEILGKTGENVCIMPGVTIGDNAVIGAGSVVTKDIPANVIAAGNPCRVIREITDKDRDYYFRDRKFDVEDYK